MTTRPQPRHDVPDGFVPYMRGLNLAGSTIRNALAGWLRFAAFLDTHDIGVLSVTPPDIDAYRAQLLQNARAPSTINSYLLYIKRVYAWLCLTGKIPVDPTRNLHLHRTHNRLPRNILTLTEMRNLLNHPEPPAPRALRNQSILELFYSTGIRLSELRNLTCTDLDFGQLTVRINQGKGARDRIVPLGRTAASALHTYLKICRPHQQAGRYRWLFPGRCPGRPVHIATIAQIVKDVSHLTALRTPLSPHGFRHACATHMMQAGASIMHIQQLLGHASPSTTQIYLRVTCTDMRKTLRQCHPREHDPRILQALKRQFQESHP